MKNAVAEKIESQRHRGGSGLIAKSLFAGRTPEEARAEDIGDEEEVADDCSCCVRIHHICVSSVCDGVVSQKFEDYYRREGRADEGYAPQAAG